MWTTATVDTVGYFSDTSCKWLAGESETDASPGCLVRARSGSLIYYVALPDDESNEPGQSELHVILLPLLS